MQPEDLSIGVVLGGRYRLEAELARGPESRVFRAAETRTGREVALKVLARDPSDKTWASRFRREANLARELQHPNTVRLLDFEVGGDTVPFIVYELLRGRTLRAVLQEQGALGEARSIHIVSQILKALMESHALGVVHRDIKPDNVFICDFAGEEDFVKVLDFGIAKSMEPEATLLTSDGMLVGTPRYMSPDQIRGEPATPSMDLYAAGLVLAEMLAGVPVVGGDHAEACRTQLAPEPLVLPEAVYRTPLGPVIERAIRKDPAARFQLAGPFLTSLKASLGSIPPPRSELPDTVDHVPIQDVLGRLPPPAGVPSPVPPRDPSAPPPPGAAPAAAKLHPIVWLTLAFAMLGVLLGAIAIVIAVTR